MAAAFVPLKTLVCWKETRSEKEKRQEDNGEGVAGKKKKHKTGTS